MSALPKLGAAAPASARWQCCMQRCSAVRMLLIISVAPLPSIPFLQGFSVDIEINMK